MKPSDIEKKFDNGEEVLGHFNLAKARRPKLSPKRVNVDFPLWMVDSLDREATRLGITRQSLIKLWLSDRLDRATAQ